MVPTRSKHVIPIPARRLTLGLIASTIAIAGCGGGGGQPEFNAQDELGRTYYLDGAGNWGYGVTEVKQGLRQAGYRGNIVNFSWSRTFNPALDQIARPIARGRGRDLAAEINAYFSRFPDGDVNIIALSAGTGVAVWACEAVEPPHQVNALILLGSSLSSTYDMRKALPRIKGGVWVFHSHNDMVLQGPVRAVGTIDGELGADSAGLVGLHPPGGTAGKIHNIAWSQRYVSYGWTGAHTDATSKPFVKNVLAPHILTPPGVSEYPSPAMLAFARVRP